MIINEVSENILESNIQSIVVPVNTVGVMGKGLALDFKNKYPGILQPYKEACKNNVFNEKGFFVYDYSEQRKIVCLPTKKEWWRPSLMKYINRCLFYLARDYSLYGIEELAIPAIGCGQGGLCWDDVRELIISNLDPIDLKVTIFLP